MNSAQINSIYKIHIVFKTTFFFLKKKNSLLETNNFMKNNLFNSLLKKAYSKQLILKHLILCKTTYSKMLIL